MGHFWDSGKSQASICLCTSTSESLQLQWKPSVIKNMSQARLSCAGQAGWGVAQFEMPTLEALSGGSSVTAPPAPFVHIKPSLSLFTGQSGCCGTAVLAGAPSHPAAAWPLGTCRLTVDLYFLCLYTDTEVGLPVALNEDVWRYVWVQGKQNGLEYSTIHWWNLHRTVMWEYKLEWWWEMS